MAIHTFDAAKMFAYWAIDEENNGDPFYEWDTYSMFYAYGGGSLPDRVPASTPWGSYSAIFAADPQAAYVDDDGGISALIQTGTFSWTFWAKILNTSISNPGYPIGLRAADDAFDWHIQFSATLSQTANGEFGTLYSTPTDTIESNLSNSGLDQWHHYGITFEPDGAGGVNITTYLDGAFWGQLLNKPIPAWSDAMRLFFGRLYAGGLPSTNQVLGSMAEVVLWKKTLSLGEMAADYGLGIPTPPAPDPAVPQLAMFPDVEGGPGIFRDIALNTAGGLMINNGDLVLIRDLAAIQQDIYLRLRFVKGEWFADLTEGVDYIGTILGKSRRAEAIRSEIKNAILGARGVKSVDSLTLALDTATRKLAVDWSATTDLGLLTDSTTIGV